MSSSRKELKVTYTITIASVEGLTKKAEGCGIHVEWKGGRKDKETPMTPSVTLAEGKSSVEFAHKVEMTTTLEYTDIANRKFQEKNLVFSVVGEKIKKKKDAVIGKATIDLGTMAFPGSFQPRQALKLATKKDKEGAGILNIVVNSKWAAKDGKKVVAGKKDKEKTDKDKDKKDKDKDSKDKDKKHKLDKRASKRDVKDKDKKDKDSKSDAGDEASGSESYSFAKKRGQGDPLEESSFQVNGEDYHLESEAEASEGEDEPSMWGEAPDKTEDYLSDSDEEGDKVEFKKDSSSADLTSSSASKDDKKKKEEEEKKKKEEADKKKKEEEDKKKKDDADKKKKEDEDKKKKDDEDKKKKEDTDKKKKEEEEKKKKEEEDKKKKDEEDKDKRKSRGFGSLFGAKDKDAKDKDKDSKDKDKDSKDKDTKDKDKRDEKSDKDKSDRDKDKSDRDRDRSDRDRSDRDKSDRSDRDRSDRDRSDRDSRRDSKILTSQPSSANLSGGASKEEIDKLKSDYSKKEEKLQKEIADKKEQITKLENELSVAKVQIQQDQDLKQWDRKPQDKQKAELKDLQETNRNLLVKNEQLEKDNKTMKTEQDSLKRQQKRLEEELSELKEELDAAKTKGSSSSKSSSSTKESPANDRSEELNKKISSLQRKLDDQQDTNKKQQDTIKQLESDLKKAQSAAASRPRDSNEEKVMGIVSSLSKGQELDSLKDRINALQDEIDNFHHVEDWVYGAEFKYDGNGKNITATELANYITDHALLESDDLDKRDFLFHLLKATVRSYRRDINNIDRLSGWMSWMITLYNSLAKSSGAEKIDKKGLDMKFSSLPSMMSALHGRGGARRAKAERSDSDSDNESSSEDDDNAMEGDIDSESLLGGLRSKLGLQERPAAFLAHLEGLIQHCYALIYSQICSELHEIKYMDILFDQSEVFHTSKKANESSSDSKKSGSNGKQKANNRIKLTKVLNAAYRRLEAHHNNKAVTAQVFAQVFYFMANSVLNKFLTTPDLCRASRAYAVKVAYSHMEIWASEKSDLINHMRNQFDILLEACNVLVIDKSIFAAEDIIPTVFLKLNPKQIKQLLVSFQPDEMAPDPVPSAAKGAIERAALKVNKEIHLDPSTLINLTP